MARNEVWKLNVEPPCLQCPPTYRCEFGQVLKQVQDARDATVAHRRQNALPLPLSTETVKDQPKGVIGNKVKQ